MRIFGREPAVVAMFLQAAIALLGQQIFDLDAGQTALVYGVAVAVLDTYVAYNTHQTLLGVVLGLTKAVIACYIGFGGDISPEATSQILAFVSTALGLIQRTQVTPIAGKGNFDLAA